MNEVLNPNDFETSKKDEVNYEAEKNENNEISNDIQENNTKEVCDMMNKADSNCQKADEVNYEIEKPESNEDAEKLQGNSVVTNIVEAQTIENAELVEEQPTVKKKFKIKLSKKLIIAILAGVLVVVGVILFLIFKPVGVESVKVSKKNVNIAPGEEYRIIYLIGPENASDKTVTWSCSDNTVVELTEGRIKGLKEGTCEVRVTTSNENIYDYCIVTVEEPVPDFKAIFDKCCSGESLVAKLGSDYSYIEIDSNPFNIDDFSLPTANVINSINKELGIPNSVYNKMISTTAMQGRQVMEYSKFTVSWTYHPDNGLEVLYELKVS